LLVSERQKHSDLEDMKKPVCLLKKIIFPMNMFFLEKHPARRTFVCLGTFWSISDWNPGTPHHVLGAMFLLVRLVTLVYQ